MNQLSQQKKIYIIYSIPLNIHKNIDSVFNVYIA